MEIRIITKENSADIRLKNEPFQVFGRLIPVFDGSTWSYSERLYAPEDVYEMRFPDEGYDFDALCGDHVFIGAYDGDKCIGLAILKDDWFKYIYLDDLKVCGEYRGQGVGTALIDACLEAARQRGYNGVYTIAQDDNLFACRFYLKNGFRIGGFDNLVYRGTVQEDKANLLLYLD